MEADHLENEEPRGHWRNFHPLPRGAKTLADNAVECVKAMAREVLVVDVPGGNDCNDYGMAHSGPAEYLVEALADNSQLQAHAPGITFRFSKQLEDRDDLGELAAFGSLVLGIDEGDGSLDVEVGRPSEVAEVENAEPSASRPETGKEAEKRGHVVEETPDEIDSEAVRAAKRARQEEIEEEGMTDHEVILKCLRYVQSSLEYTARQAAALKQCQEQLGEIGWLRAQNPSGEIRFLPMEIQGVPVLSRTGAERQREALQERRRRKEEAEQHQRDLEASTASLETRGAGPAGYVRSFPTIRPCCVGFNWLPNLHPPPLWKCSFQDFDCVAQPKVKRPGALKDFKKVRAAAGAAFVGNIWEQSLADWNTMKRTRAAVLEYF
eukprot:s86_g12.t1